MLAAALQSGSWKAAKLVACFLKGFLKTYNVARRPMEQVAKVASKNRMPPLMRPGLRYAS
jgi:hypothetical protein